MVGRLATLTLLGAIAAAIHTPPAHPAPAAVPDGACTVFVDKVARPTSLLLGDEVEISLTVEARCPAGSGGAGPADIVLALDRSASMGDNGLWPPAVDAAAAFVDLIDFGAHRVGVVSFSGGLPILNPEAEVHQELAADRDLVLRALRAIPAPPTYTGPTNITAAIRASQGELTSPRHRADARRVLVLLTDGEHNAPGRAPLAEATDAKAAGTEIVTIGLGTSAAAADQLRQIASRPELFFESPTAEQLKDVYTAVAGVVTGGGSLTDLVITDLLTTDVEYVADSANPAPALISPGQLQWALPALPPNGWAVHFRVTPLRTGTYATNKLAYVDYVDGDGTMGSLQFPQPLIKVRAPGENGVFLPLLLRDHCPPQRPFDVALIMDVSSSMSGPKLTQARVAAREFLDLLNMPPSRAAIVAFHGEASLVRPLTTDRAAAAVGLDNLPRGEGSRIDLALDTARGALTGADADPGHAKVIILLTDGLQTGAPEQDAYNAAAAARRAGITVFTIGVGADTTGDFLIRLAGDPDRYYPAADENSLLRIYRTIAGTLPCRVR